MNLLNWLKRFESDEPDNLEDIFQLVYARTPSQAELDFSVQLTSALAKNDRIGIFRAIVNGYNHLRLNTPFTVRFSKQDVEYMTIQDFQLAIDRTDISVSMPLLRGEYEPHLIKFFRERLEPGMVFVDVGANVGLYSMLAAQIVGSSGKVFCFEPNSENCRLIMLSIHRNAFENISVFPFALGNKIGPVLFSTHIGSNGGLIPDTQDSLLNPSCAVMPMVRLEDMISEKVDLIKIDVEGAEGLVVEGAKQLIERYRPIVTSEFSLEMLPRVSKMSGRGYLGYFKTNQYEIYLCDRYTHELVAITDIDSFIGNYEIGRLEDLVFLPQ
jgi:FkbM family methyltransferase